VFKLNSSKKFDCIVLTGSVAETPEFLLDNIKQGGKIFAIIGKDPIMTACLIRKKPDGATEVETLFETMVKALVNTEETSIFEL
jgi:protein-L-isoaspartate(D-aspartate) O-methyltransferase